MIERAAIAECLKAGVREFCVCAGSRNSPLVLQILAVKGAKVYHFFEERCASFFALGRAREAGRPVAVVVTSGTAAAEVLPAMIEAHYQGMPLLAITADRPRRFRGSGAPQAIEQQNIFGVFTQVSMDAETEDEVSGSMTGWRATGPAHLNVCLEEPTAETLAAIWPLELVDKHQSTEPDCNHGAALAHFLSTAQDLFVMLGDLTPAESLWVRDLLPQLPPHRLWAEAASNLRSTHWRQLVASGEGELTRMPAQSVLRIGGVPSCRFWRELESRPEISVLSITRSGHSGLARDSKILPIGFELKSAKNGSSDFIQAERDSRLDSLLTEFPLSECALLRRLSQVIPPQAQVFLGNSLVIREWNLAAEISAHPPQTFALRGANGIDGNLSFFFGIGSESAESWAVVGDLTALYDLASPWIMPQLKAGKRRVVIINNGGGKIFSRLPSLEGITEAERRIMENTHQIDFANWAAQWGMSYHKVTQWSQWPETLSGDRCDVIEIVPDPEQSAHFWDRWADNKSCQRILALHGNFGSADDWADLESAMKAKFLCANLWSAPYAGRSLSEVSQIMSSEQGPDILLGYSLGARLGLHALLDFPGRWATAILISGTAGLELDEDRELREQKDREWAELARLLPWKELLRQWNGQAIFQGSLAPTNPPGENFREAVAQGFEKWSLGLQENFWPRLKDVAVPVLWITGERDEKYTQLAMRAVALMPNARHFVIPNCGHRVHLEAPKIVASAIYSFLTHCLPNYSTK